MFKQNLLGICCLLVAVLALGLAVIPGIAFDRPITVLPPPPPPQAEETSGGVTLRYKGLAMNLGGKTKPVPKAEAKKLLSPRDYWLKGFTLAAVGCSLVGMVLGTFSWAYEKQPAISGPAMLIASIALTWQYIAIGIAAGVAIAVILLIMGAIG
jgi:hypothetical protein